MKKVDYLIISTGRAASTAIYKYLDYACDLHLPWNKEPHFWCDINNYKGTYGLLKSINIQDTECYYQLYSGSDLVIDASVGYFFCIDEVIQKLQKHGQKPKVIFLYREPESRAKSLFHELKKKNLNSAAKFVDDIEVVKSTGLWWELYYDNVLYSEVFSKMENYFDHILAINYDYFSCHQKEMIKNIADFIGKKPVNLEQLDLRPVNSSQDAIVLSKFGFARRISKFFPKSFIRYFLKKVGSYLMLKQKQQAIDLSTYLPVSIRQYIEFRKHINNEDVYVRRNCSK